MALGGSHRLWVSSLTGFKCSRVKGEASTLGTCYSLAPRAGSDEETMAHLLMYSTNYTVCVAPPLCTR